jgi:SAM-dependent methyltransferase
VDTQAHWDAVYGSKRDEEVSWTEPDPRTSLSLIGELAPPPARVIDVGGGTSRLAGRLLDGGYTVAVLDVSGAALTRARDALGERGAHVRWVVADVTAQPPLELGTFDVWHDRAVFHFLTEAGDRSAYAALAARTVLATFALDGPEKCSGLPVCRYDGARLAAELGEPFALIKSVPVVHVTPWGKPQSFQYAVLRRT